VSKVTAIPCPTPGCGKTLQVKTTERGRPSVSCKLADGGCGWTGFVNAQKGVALWAGESVPAAAPGAAPKTEPAAIAETPARRKSDEGGFKFPWQE